MQISDFRFQDNLNQSEICNLKSAISHFAWLPAGDQSIAVSPAINLHTVNGFDRLVTPPHESFELRVIVQRKVFPHLHVCRRGVEDIRRQVLP